MAEINLDETIVEAMACEHVARIAIRQLLEAAASSSSVSSIPAHQLWRYARRRPGEPADLKIEQALRSEPRTSTAYRRLLSGLASDYAPLAMAAATDAYPERSIGSHRLQVIDEGDAVYLVVSNMTEHASRPRMLVLAGPEGEARIELPPAIRGFVTVPLSPRLAERKLILRLLAAVGTEIFLL